MIIRLLLLGVLLTAMTSVSADERFYNFPAKDGINESRPFGENMTFRITLQSVAEIR